jgi:hypothetical protein
MNTAPLITKCHNITCPYGHKCCATYHGNRDRRTVAARATRRAMRKRDRRLARLDLGVNG